MQHIKLNAINAIHNMDISEIGLKVFVAETTPSSWKLHGYQSNWN